MRYLVGGLRNWLVMIGMLAANTALAVNPFPFGISELKAINDGKFLAVGAGYDSPTGANRMALARYTEDGALDPTFGDNGVAMTQIDPASDDFARVVAVQPDGKIVVGGKISAVGGHPPEEFALARYDADGRLDATFGGSGFVTTDFGATGEICDLYDVAIQPDGKIVAVGYTSMSVNDIKTASNYAVVRYLPNGALDPSFGDGGKVVTDIGSDAADPAWNQAIGVRIMRNGNLQVIGSELKAGDRSTDYLDVTEYLPSGALNTRFGDGGTAAFRIADRDHQDAVISTVWRPNGKWVALLYSQSGFAVAQGRGDGLDASFGIAGVAQLPTYGDYTYGSLAIALQEDGKILAARSYSYHCDTGNRLCSGAEIIRLKRQGGLDPSFGTGGIVKLDASSYSTNALLVQSDGRILLGGSGGGHLPFFGLVRLKPDGSIDESFGQSAHAGSRPDQP